MPLLHSGELLPQRPRRVLVAGTSGAGKTTAATLIATVLGVPRIEIDGLFHGPAWQPRPSFEADVQEFAATDAWVTEWQYDAVRPLLAARADLLVWLDLSRAHVMRQLIVRTVARRFHAEPLWNGNREQPLWTVLTDPEHVVRWAWATHPDSGPRVLALAAARPDLVVVRLRSRQELRSWLAGSLTHAATPQEPG